MTMTTLPPAVIFDLDDTLFAERDYLISAYRAIDRHLVERGIMPPGMAFDVMTGEGDAFDSLAAALASRGEASALTVADMVEIYRTHTPSLSLPAESLSTLMALHSRGIPMGLITDGRVNTQSAKIKALGLERFIDRRLMIISEAIGHDKRSPVAFEMIERALAGRAGRFIYVGDNPAKDFDRPGQRGWATACLRSRGHNIHPQRLETLGESTVVIDRLTDVIDLVSRQ